MGRALATLAACLVVASCSLMARPSANGVVPDADMLLQVDNESTLAVQLLVNGRPIAQVTGQSTVGLAADRLPALPWDARLVTPTGRVVLQLTVHSGDVSSVSNADGTSSSQGDGARVDLSCGRIDMWSGPPMLGPAPGSGTPGDCNP